MLIYGINDFRKYKNGVKDEETLADRSTRIWEKTSKSKASKFACHFLSSVPQKFEKVSLLYPNNHIICVIKSLEWMRHSEGIRIKETDWGFSENIWCLLLKIIMYKISNKTTVSTHVLDFLILLPLLWFVVANSFYTFCWKIWKTFILNLDMS